MPNKYFDGEALVGHLASYGDILDDNTATPLPRWYCLIIRIITRSATGTGQAAHAGSITDVWEEELM